MILKFPIIRLKRVESTNSYAQKIIQNKNALDGMVVYADEQMQGKGQYGSYWHSAPGENLTFSVIYFPKQLLAHEQFYLSKAISVAVRNFLLTEIKNVWIKWPNDIYVGKKKIAGILIENIIEASEISKCVLGVGLNVNQKKFPSEIPNPISLSVAKKDEIMLDKCFDKLLGFIDKELQHINDREFKKLDESYFDALLNYKRWAFYKTKEGKEFEGQISDIMPMGELIVTTRDNNKRNFGFKEIEYIF